MLDIHAVFFHISREKFRFSFFTSRPSVRQWSLISLCLYKDPLRGNGHGFSLHRGPLRGNGHQFLYIKTLCEAMLMDFLIIEALYEKMVIDFFTSRPSARHWSLIFIHQNPLRGNGHWFLCHIKALYEVMVIDSFTSRPSTRQWSLISLFTSRPSARQWSSISLYQDPLRGNGHWSLYIKTLYEALVIDFFTSRPSAM